MWKRPIVPLATMLVLLSIAAPAVAQEPTDCPTVEDVQGVPVELRIGELVLRAQVSGEAGDSAGSTRVQGRIIGCERAPVDGAARQHPDDEPAVQGLGSVLRLLHDLRVGLELGPVQDGRCVRASLDVTDGAGGLAGAAGDGPLVLQLCGLPTNGESASP